MGSILTGKTVSPSRIAIRSWTWITTFSNNVTCLLDRNMFCVNLIVLQKEIFSLSCTKQSDNIFAPLYVTLASVNPPRTAWKTGGRYAYPRLRTFVIDHGQH